ncbi:ABC transporter permease [Mesorhizobium sp. KR9-304]|uniref:ABC transporter permease n=1 Tax=Mesorhizobium sp. KR9-304 TaxID=3156614 RepID=UPI0032B533A6
MSWLPHTIREHSVVSMFVALQLVLVIWALVAPDSFRYLSASNINVALRAIPPLAIMAMGVGVLMLAGEFDLSVGSNYTFSAVVMASAFNSGLDPFLSVALAILAGTAIGLLNGVVALTFDIPSFIVTLGAMLVWRGGVLYYNGPSSEPFRPEGPFNAVFSDGILLGDIQISAGVFWLLIIGVVLGTLVHLHRYGNHLLAVGGNRNAAVAIGVQPTRTKLIAFAIAGGCAAFAGVLATARIHQAQPGQGGGLELQAIAACVIGGVALTGGRGSVLGMIVGTWLVFTIQDVLLLLRAPGFYLDVFIGAVLVAAVIGNRAVRGRT